LLKDQNDRGLNCRYIVRASGQVEPEVGQTGAYGTNFVHSMIESILDQTFLVTFSLL
jgi:hypothetical protein